MGVAAIRRKLGLPPHKDQVRVRRLTLDVPVELMERVRHHHARYVRTRPGTPESEHAFVVGLLASVVRHLDREEQVEDARSRLVQPASLYVPIPKDQQRIVLPK